jgi:hypothetical protein
MLRYGLVAVLGCAFATAVPVVAADAVKVEVKDFKWKAAVATGAELGGYDDGEGRFYFYTNGTATGKVTIPEDGEYTITVEASCVEAQKEFAKFKLTAGETVVAKEHACTTEEKKKYTFTAKLKKGEQPLVIEYLNDVFKEGEYDRNLFVYSVAIEKK